MALALLHPLIHLPSLPKNLNSEIAKEVIKKIDCSSPYWSLLQCAHMICNIAPHPPAPFLQKQPCHTETRKIMMGQKSISTTLSYLFCHGHRGLNVKGSMYSEKTLVKDIKPRRESLHYAFLLKVIVSGSSLLLAGSQSLCVIFINWNLQSANIACYFEVLRF